MQDTYLVTRLDINNNNIDILDYFNSKPEALQFMSLYIDSEDQFKTNWYRKIVDNDEQVSIYQLGYILPKTLVYRYFIKRCHTSLEKLEEEICIL